MWSLMYLERKKSNKKNVIQLRWSYYPVIYYVKPVACEMMPAFVLFLNQPLLLLPVICIRTLVFFKPNVNFDTNFLSCTICYNNTFALNIVR